MQRSNSKCAKMTRSVCLESSPKSKYATQSCDNCRTNSAVSWAGADLKYKRVTAKTTSTFGCLKYRVKLKSEFKSNLKFIQCYSRDILMLLTKVFYQTRTPGRSAPNFSCVSLRSINRFNNFWNPLNTKKSIKMMLQNTIKNS